MTGTGDPIGLAHRLIALAGELDLRMAVAESLTGGLLADALVSVPGASRVITGGIVAYDTALKHSLLGVDAELLRRRGPVDELVAEQMAAGVRTACRVPARAHGVDLGISTTGVAGPDPDPQTGQAAGVVWVGVSFRERTRTARLQLAGERGTIRYGAVAAALRLTIALVEEESGARKL